MAYATTTISSITPAKDVSDWLKTQMTANGWTAVETWTSGAATAEILKSPSAGNSIAQDFYIALYRPTDANAGLYLSIFLEWDAVNKKRKKYAPSDTTGNITALSVDTDQTVAGAGILPSSSSNVLVQIIATNPNVIFGQFDADTVAFGATGNDSYGQFIYLGVYDRLLPSSVDATPLVMLDRFYGKTQTEVNSHGAVVKEIGNLSSGSYNWTATLADIPAYAPYAGSTSPNNVLSPADPLRPNASAQVWFSSGRGSATGFSVASPRGLLKHCVTSRSGGAFGDTLTITALDGSSKHYKLASLNNTSGVMSSKVFISTD